MLSGLDYGVIGLYFFIVLGIGSYLAKKASANVGEYFLGGRHIPWYFLGIAGMVTYADISGTMVQTSFYYLFGVKGFWIAFRGAIALILAFYMIYMAKWLRRSGVMTNAEWMSFRFGTGRQGQIARLCAACAILVSASSFLGVAFVGAGKFFSQYLPWGPTVSGIILFAVVGTYTIASGFYGVVYTDLFQGFLVLTIIFFFAVKGMTVGTPAYFAQYASPDWLSLIPRSWDMNVPAGYEEFRHISLMILVWLVFNIMSGFGQPHDSWTSQKFYAAKNEREGSLIALQWILLFPLRFLMFMGVGILAISVASKISDPEMALHAVIAQYVPAGMLGVVLAAFMAAGMSTLNGTLNSSAAYFVNDIYSRYINPAATMKHQVRVSHITTFALMVIGVLIGVSVPNINKMWGWIIMGLFTGMTVPNIFKWFWWRFNGLGYAGGMAAGIISAILQARLFPDAEEYTRFGIIVAISAVGTLTGTFLGKPTDMDVMVNFYKKTRPFGFWAPVRAACFDSEMVHSIRKENTRDLLLLPVACLFQLCWIWIMNAIVVKAWVSVAGTAVTLIVLGFVLYKYWYKNLKIEKKA